MEVLHEWLHLAGELELNDPNATALTASNSLGVPSVSMVFVKVSMNVYSAFSPMRIAGKGRSFGQILTFLCAFIANRSRDRSVWRGLPIESASVPVGKRGQPHSLGVLIENRSSVRYMAANWLMDGATHLGVS
jgi:hypothetical protein